MGVELEAALEQLGCELSGFEPSSLLRTLAGLQLDPHNAALGLRLEYLSNLALVYTRPGGRVADAKTVRRLLEGDALGHGEITREQDPFSNLFVTSIGFAGRSFSILPGINENLGFDFQQLLGVLFQSDFSCEDQLRRFCWDINQLALVLSDHICRAAGLEPGTRVSQPIPGKLHLTKDAARLSSACFFTHELLGELAAQHKLDLRLLTFLLCRPEIGKRDLVEGPLHRGPLVEFPEGFLVGIPSALCVAARYAVLHRLLREGHSAGLSDALAANTAGKLRWRLNGRRLDVEPAIPPPTGCAAIALKFDERSAVVLTVFADNLEDWDPESCHGLMHFAPEQELKAFLSSVVDAALGHAAVDEVFVIFASIGVGRLGALGFPWAVPPGTEVMTGSAEDIWILCSLEEGDIHAIRRFQRQLTLFKQKCKSLAFSLLDYYSIYLNHKRSFYLSDQKLPDLIHIACDENRVVKERYESRFRPQWVPAFFNSGGVIEVETPFEDAPISVPTMPFESRVAIFLDDFWLISPILIPEHAKIYQSLLNAIAYWLGFFLPKLSGGGQWPFCTEVVLEQPEDWLQASEFNDSEDDSWFTLRAVSQPFQCNRVGITSAFRRLGLTSDNSAELELVDRLIRSTLTLEISDSRRLAALKAEAASNPLRKMLLLEIFDAGLRLDPRGLTKVRCVSEAACDMVLEDLGEYLTGEGRLPGALAQSERIELLNQAVGHLFDELTRHLSQLEFGQTLELLVTQNESLLHQQAHLERYSVYSAACFPAGNAWAGKHAAETSSLAAAALANRFLIELLSSGSTRLGEQRPSLEDYDRLLALALELSQLAEYSDILHLNLLDVNVEMLPSGRLGIEGAEFCQKLQAFNHSFHSQGLQKKHDTLNAEGQEFDLIELDEACQEEWGYSYTQLLQGVHSLGLSTQESPTFASLSKSEAIRVVAAACAISNEVATQLLRDLTQPRREEFSRPPKPFRAADTSPWRFQRPLSYLRKPIVESENELAWGQRNLSLAPRFLLQQMVAGRYQAKSGKLQLLLGKWCQLSGKAFVDRIFETLSSHGKLKCAKNVDRIHGQVISENGNPLGDVDVLCVDVSRREIWALECKAYERARVPHEFSAQLKKLLDNKNGHVAKHLRRVEWVRSHRVDVLAHFKITPSKKELVGWRVRSRILVEDEIFAPYLQKPSIEVIGWQKFKERFFPRKGGK